jgi:SsrA-binding protein
VEGGEAILVGAHVPEYSHGNRTNHEPTRTRKLLLHKKEIQRLQEGLEQKGLTIVPLKMYWKNGRAKIEIALARGKKLHDRREDTAKREAQRDMERAARRMRES